MPPQNHNIILEKMKVPELKLIAKQYDIINVCKMKKDCLIENIKKTSCIKKARCIKKASCTKKASCIENVG